MRSSFGVGVKRSKPLSATTSPGEPAYDLTPSTPISAERRDLAMTCGDLGRFANRRNLLSQCERFLLEADEAAEIYEGLEETIRDRWRGIARSAGVSARDCDLIASAFVYPGLDL